MEQETTLKLSGWKSLGKVGVMKQCLLFRQAASQLTTSSSTARNLPVYIERFRIQG
jgi:hypothetical protein